MLPEWRIAGIVDVLTDASRAYEVACDVGIPFDAPHEVWPSYGGAIQHRLWEGLEALRDLDAEDADSLWEILDRLDEETLRLALAQAARELHDVGWTPPGLAEDEDEDAP